MVLLDGDFSKIIADKETKATSRLSEVISKKVKNKIAPDEDSEALYKAAVHSLGKRASRRK